jgi:hypothetical protein
MVTTVKPAKSKSGGLFMVTPTLDGPNKNEAQATVRCEGWQA